MTRSSAKPHRFKIDQHGEIRRNPWAAWLKRHGLSIEAAEKHTQAVKVLAEGAALVMANHLDTGHGVQLLSGGRGIAGTPNYSERDGERRDLVHVFGSIADFLAYLSLYGRTVPSGGAFILHVPRTVPLVSARIHTANMRPDGAALRVVLWLGNTEGARAITDELLGTATRRGFQAATMNHVYEGFPSLFDWYSATRPAQREADQPKQYDDTAWQMVRARPSSAGPNGPG